MGTFKVIPKELKEQILKRIKEEGITVAQASANRGSTSAASTKGHIDYHLLLNPQDRKQN